MNKIISLVSAALISLSYAPVALASPLRGDIEPTISNVVENGKPVPCNKGTGTVVWVQIVVTTNQVQEAYRFAHCQPINPPVVSRDRVRYPLNTLLEHGKSYIIWEVPYQQK